MDILHKSLGQLARDIPGATRVFRKYQLNYCCGGHIPLVDAVAVRQGDGPAAFTGLEVVTVLEQLQRQPARQQQANGVEVIDYIVSQLHSRHRQLLPELLFLAIRVEQEHSRHPHCPVGLARRLQLLYQDLDEHMYREQQELFPMLLRPFSHCARRAVAVSRLQHAHYGAELDGIEHLTRGMELPASACESWQILYSGLRQLRHDLMQHIHLENNVLFFAIDDAASIPARGQQAAACGNSGAGLAPTKIRR